MTALTSSIIPSGTNRFQKVFSVPIDSSNNEFTSSNPMPVYDSGIGGWDSCVITYPTVTAETYLFKTGTVTAMTVSIVYTDATKYRMSSITRV
jgi:hypothetical protein